MTKICKNLFFAIGARKIDDFLAYIKCPIPSEMTEIRKKFPFLSLARAKKNKNFLAYNHAPPWKIFW